MYLFDQLLKGFNPLGNGQLHNLYACVLTLENRQLKRVELPEINIKLQNAITAEVTSLFVKCNIGA